MGKKKSILPYVLIGVGVVAVAAVLFLVVLKTSYDITGTWSETDTIWTGGATSIVFSGSKTSGSVALVEFDDTGAYTVDGKTVHFEFSLAGYDYKWVFDGQFDSKDKMSGTVQYYYNNVVDETGTWTATRIASAPAGSQLPAAKRSARQMQ